MGALRDNSSHRKIREILLERTGVGSCHGLSNQCTFGLGNQYSGSYAPTTELEIIMFRPFPFREIVWHLRTKVNDSDVAA